MVRAARLNPTDQTGPKRAASRVYDHIFDQITSGVYAKDARLPTEAELAESFAVSRSVVREALARLRDDGLVQSRQGAGSFVAGRPDKAIRVFAPLSSIEDIQRCYEFRGYIEQAACGMAAARRDAEQLQKIHQLMIATEEAADFEMGLQADADFHFAIAEAAANRFFTDTLALLRSHLIVGMGLTRRLSLSRPADDLKLMHQEHRAIYDALAMADPDRASEAMRAHLEAARARVFQG
jgi:GntR family transcriptional repressor for pyruvate dehydrogenase complex